MARLRAREQPGRLTVEAPTEALAAAAQELALRVWEQGGRARGAAELGGQRAFVKAGPLAGWARARWSVLCAGLGRALPCLAEYENLGWLRAHGFGAPEPLAAAWITRHGAPRFQLLATRAVEGTRDAQQLLCEGTPEERRGLLRELAEQLGRLHALGFVHRDLFPRNVLVRARAGAPELVFLDCPKAGRARPGRGPAYDLGAWLLRAPEWIGAELQREFVRDYLRARAAQGRPLRDARAFARQVTRARCGLARRLAARPDEWRGLPGPQLEWTVEAT